MSLALTPQCCCGGPGVTRTQGLYSGFFGSAVSDHFLTFRFINVADDIVSTAGAASAWKTKRWPCWVVPYYDPGHGQIYDGGQSGHHPTPIGIRRVDDLSGIGAASFQFDRLALGFTHEFNAMIYATAYNWYDGGLYADPTFTPNRPGVVMAKLGKCGIYTADIFGGGGLCEWTELISSEDAFAIVSGQFPAGSWLDLPAYADGVTTEPRYRLKQSTWCAASLTRLYGYTRYDGFPSGGDDAADFERYFKAWSVKYDGSDYTEHFTIHKTGDDANDGLGIPITMNVCNDVIYFAAKTSTSGFGDIHYYTNGSSIGGFSDSPAPFASLAQGPRSGQLFVLTEEYASAGQELAIFSNGADISDQQLRFIAIVDDDGHTVEYTPTSISYDTSIRAVVVTWGAYLQTDEWSAPYAYSNFTTYFMGDVTPGNVVGQDNVLIYADFPAGDATETPPNVFYLPSAPPTADNRWAIVICGKMPRPTGVTAGHIDPPPPPPPPPPTCDGLTGCEGVDMPDAELDLGAFTVFDEVLHDDVRDVDFTRHWTLSNLNGPYILSYLSGLAWDLQVGTDGDYGDPGIPVFWDEYSAPYTDVLYEGYLEYLREDLSCNSGTVAITVITLEMQTYTGLHSSGTPILDIVTSGAGGAPTTIVEGQAASCFASVTAINVIFQDLFTTGVGDGSHNYVAATTVGGILL